MHSAEPSQNNTHTAPHTPTPAGLATVDYSTWCPNPIGCTLAFMHSWWLTTAANDNDHSTRNLQCASNTHCQGCSCLSSTSMHICCERDVPASSVLTPSKQMTCNNGIGRNVQHAMLQPLTTLLLCYCCAASVTQHQRTFCTQMGDGNAT